jgi:hypothetical protein
MVFPPILPALQGAVSLAFAETRLASAAARRAGKRLKDLRPTIRSIYRKKCSGGVDESYGE